VQAGSYIFMDGAYRIVRPDLGRPALTILTTVISRRGDRAIVDAGLKSLTNEFGAPAGKALKGADLADVVLITAKDNYAVALSLADTDPMVRKDQIILADKADGAPLPDGLGPYRLVIEGDQRGARMARMVVSIALLRAAPSARASQAAPGR